MEVWPAIDLRGGKCVRLRQGDYDQETVFDDDPVAAALRWQASGARFLHLVDLDGAKQGCPVNLEVVRGIVTAVEMTCELGGGVRSQESIEQLLELGLDRVVIGTKALREPQWFAEMCERHPSRLALGLDARNGMVATDGWLQTSDTPASRLMADFVDAPLAAVIYTDIAKDGMMQGPNVAAIEEMAAVCPHPVIASGGVTTLEDVKRLAATGAAGCIIGRAIYEGSLLLEDALAAAG